MMWLKYDGKPISLLDYEDRVQGNAGPDGYRSSYEKPRGCWFTDDSEDCWQTWCIKEGFRLEGLSYKHEVMLDETNIIFLRSPIDIDLFTQEYGKRVWWGPDGQSRKYFHTAIEWERVALRYDGIIITPYQWSMRMTPEWYYPWDCASGCIWRIRAIKAIRLIEVQKVFLLREEEEAE